MQYIVNIVICFRLQQILSSNLRTIGKRYIEHYDKTHLYHIMCPCVRTMCDFIGYEIKGKNRMKNEIVEDWEAEPELEKVQEEKQQEQPIPVMQ